MRNSFCGTPHIPFKVYFPIYIPASNINQMWQRSLTSPVKDARISWSSEFRRRLEKKGKGTWSWSESWGCSYHLRSILNSISLLIRKTRFQRKCTVHELVTHTESIRDNSTAVPNHVHMGQHQNPRFVLQLFKHIIDSKPCPTIWLPAAAELQGFCWYQPAETIWFLQ